jgi:Tol biopolymer transport system component
MTLRFLEDASRRRSVTVVLWATLLLLALGNTASAQSAPFAGCPAWVADGSGLIYCAGSDGYAELYEAAADGSVRQLTYLGGVASAPSVSPDGSLVTFQATILPGQDPQIYVVAREGQRGRTVIVGSAVIDIDGVRATQLTSDGANVDPAFAPDGQRIDFTSDRSGVTQLWSMAVDGSDQRQLLLASVGE